MDSHKALLRAMDRCNRNLKTKFEGALIRFGVAPNFYKLRLVGELYDSKGVKVLEVSYNGFEKDLGDIGGDE